MHDGLLYQKSFFGVVINGFVEGYQCDDLIIPETIDGTRVIEIADNAFRGENCIKTLTIPTTLDKIGENAFALCRRLKKVIITKTKDFEETNTLLISKAAFRNCYDLQSFSGKMRTLTIKECAFDSCYSLSYFFVGVQHVEDEAFLECRKLDFIMLSPSTSLSSHSIAESNIQELLFYGDAILKKDILSYIKKNKIKIICSQTSNLVDLVYDGYNLEIDNTL